MLKIERFSLSPVHICSFNIFYQLHIYIQITKDSRKQNYEMYLFKENTSIHILN